MTLSFSIMEADYIDVIHKLLGVVVSYQEDFSNDEIDYLNANSDYILGEVDNVGMSDINFLL